MEQVLDEYERPYDPNNPRLCFDERPCQLLSDVLMPMAMEPGQVKREDYHYERNGTCVVLMAVEPLTGKRIVKVTERKTKKDYTEFMKEIEYAYRKAHKITMIQDNLNTHNPSSFYENLDPQEAFALSERFAMVYTPKKASWLNMAEIELSALSKQCLDRRIGDQTTLASEVIAWARRRNRQKIKIQWSFSKNKARIKLERLYKSVQKLD